MCKIVAHNNIIMPFTKRQTQGQLLKKTKNCNKTRREKNVNLSYNVSESKDIVPLQSLVRVLPTSSVSEHMNSWLEQ